MLALPSDLRHEPRDSLELADWIELLLSLESTTEDRISEADITDLVVSEPPDDAEAEMDPEGYRSSAALEVSDAFRYLRTREGWLGERYPLVTDTDRVQVRDSFASAELHRFLIALRARHLFSELDDGNVPGRLFEELAVHAFGQYIGANPKNRVRFGVAGGGRGGGLPPGNQRAAAILSGRMNEEAGNAPPGNGEDLGADGIAWRPFGDGGAGQLVILGGATIAKKKWISIEPEPRWRRHSEGPEPPIRFLAQPVTAVAFVSTLEPDVQWPPGFRSIPFDRLRILSILGDHDLPPDLLTKMRSYSTQLGAKLPV
ncbi:MAG: hypothetical protein F4W96_09815 [Chloroflexi bacterium]|nr:hypothetical protein [Chloroflexota bacterium]